MVDPAEINDAVAELDRQIERDSRNPELYRALSAALRAAGRETEAMAAALAAQALDARSALALYNLATAYFQRRQNAPAARWYRLALELDPTLVLAHQNLAAIYEDDGDATQARHHRDEAFRRQSLFVETAPNEKRRVLILAAAAFGNIPIDFLFPPQTTTRIKWFIDYARDGQSAALPPFDLVFNAAGDADLSGPPPAEVARFLARCDKPVLNPPAAIAGTRRDLMPELFSGIGGVIVPPVLRIARPDTATAAARLDAASIAFPVLVRPIGSHGGKGVTLAKTRDDLMAVDFGSADAFYLTAYHDCRAADGHYRKYRAIFVDREPFPYHLAISPHWLVHYFSADMLAAPWKRDEEARFLADPATVLGARATAAIAAIGRRLDLDFGGVDFSLLPDGRVLVFEANATMLVHLGDDAEQFPYKHTHVPKIAAAFEAMAALRTVVR